MIATNVGPLEGELAISSATLVKLHAGVLVATLAGVRAERLRRLSILQHNVNSLPVDEAVAASYGRLAAAVLAAGREPLVRTMDPLIAATAHTHSARVYPPNARDFVGVDSLVEVVAV